MNLLPFVFTFLMLLTLISSFLFSSVMGTARESTIILAKHQAYLTLLSNQHDDRFKSLEKKKPKKNPPDDPEVKTAKTETKKKEKKTQENAPRAIQDGCEKSKFNLISLVQGHKSDAHTVLEQIAAALIENLYGSCSFYKKGAAQTIVKQMIQSKIESLEELQMHNPELNHIYYKMLKGTSTGFPALSEYFSLSKEAKAPIYFRFASKPVLQAALGESFAQMVFDAELKNWQKNKKCKAMTKEEFLALAKEKNTLLIPALFDFDNKHKGLGQVHHEDKIRAFHTVSQNLSK